MVLGERMDGVGPGAVGPGAGGDPKAGEGM